MSRRERLDELLARWEELREQGQEVSPEDLARAEPDLLEDLRAAVRRLRALDWLDDAGAAADTPPDTGGMAGKVPAVLGGRYRLERLLAEGGFSQVWRAFDTALQRAVAVKVTAADCLTEARRVARLRHPGIVTVHDAGNDAGLCFIVFDLLEGPDLAGRVRGGRLPWREAVELVAAVAENLHHAHEMGFIHRDIKPANILLDAQGRPVLADFGIAVTPCELRQETVSTPGTLAYMAPEQLGGAGEVGPRTDIYGLGVVLYQILTGRLPFGEQTLWGLRRQILTTEPPSVRDQAPDVPPEVEALCLSCLAKDPGRRPVTAPEVAERLRTCLRGGG
jgi:eukaryotic-like serine/threonine-protein kinase